MQALRGLGYFITSLLMYLGVPLLGWGVGDLPGFFAGGPRLGYALVVLAVGLVVGWQTMHTPEAVRGNGGRADKLVPRQRVVRIVITLLMYGALLFLPFADRRGIGALGEGLAARWLGVVLFGLGIGLVIWSGFALGKLYSGDVTLQEDHHLVTDGPYRWVRHPRYTGAILLGFGLALTYNSWIGLVVSVLFIGVILFRIKDEEALMGQEFGEAWADYCARTRRLVPFLY